jgi:hypothetical protein
MTGEKIFTTWLTSSDRVDHAVTDEEFTAHSRQLSAVTSSSWRRWKLRRGRSVRGASHSWLPANRCATSTSGSASIGTDGRHG